MIAAPIDSAAVAGALAGAAAGWLNTQFPGMDPATLDKLANVLGSIPVIACIFLWELIGKGLGKFHAPFECAIGPFWAKWKVFLNPILGLVLGTATGNPIMGLVASGVWSVGSGGVKALAGSSTQSGKRRAGLGVILLALLLLPSVASAAKPYAVGNFPFVFQAGVGERAVLQASMWDQQALAYAWTHATFPVTNRWVLRVRVDQPVQKERLADKLGKAEGRLEFGFSFP